MPGKRLSMRRIKEVLRLRFEVGLSHHLVAHSCGLGRTTVREYLQRAERAGVSWPLPEAMTDGELEALLFPPPPAGDAARPLPDWQQLRRKTFIRLYGKILGDLFPCVDCGQPVTEAMQCCPWCASERNRYDSRTPMTHVCRRCHRGVSPEWRYCPWCYGPGFVPQPDAETPVLTFHGQCGHCGGSLTRFMKYCPWCRRKVTRPWVVRPFPEVCGGCGQSVDSAFWHWCPWCKRGLH